MNIIDNLNDDQVRLVETVLQIAEHDGINTFHWRMDYNDGRDCQYEFLNSDGTIYAIELIDTSDGAATAYDVLVKRKLNELEWLIESESTMHFYEPRVDVDTLFYGRPGAAKDVL